MKDVDLFSIIFMIVSIPVGIFAITVVDKIGFRISFYIG